MKIKSQAFTACLLVAISAGTAHADAIGSSITSINNGNGTASGQLDGTSFTLSNLGAPRLLLLNLDLSAGNPDYDAEPLSNSETMLSYSADSDVAFSAAAPIDDFLLYGLSWSIGSYEFDQSFTIVDGFADATIDSNILKISSVSNGILLFDGPVSTFNLDATTDDTGNNVTKFGVVPEPSSLALLGLSGLMVARRRR